MPVIAVVNRKGGSGKSTLAAHLAAWCAHQGYAVMLGDVDRQQSTRSWLRRRNPVLPSIAPWNMDQNTLRVPTGISHVVLDTPGGLHGLDLARMVMFSDVILMPVCSSSFDRESAADCYAELMALPRIASGRCKVACIGMRIDPRTRHAQVIRDWAATLNLPFLGVLRESQAYVQTLERGMTIFDVSPERVETDRRQWDAVLDWLTPRLTPAPAATPASVVAGHAPPAPSGVVPQTRPITSVAAQIQAARAVPAVQRIESTRVLDRRTPAQHGTVTALPQRNPSATPEAIPSFLKLVKC